MTVSSVVVDRAEELAAAGHHAEVVDYLGTQRADELEESPSLALLYGTAKARLGHHDEGLRWLDLALEQARRREDLAVERRALNARGAIALVSGRIDEAADYFTRGLMVASRDGDLATAGRCSNNLGIISDLRGRHTEAIGSWEIAAAAFERAALPAGVAECRHNVAISYRAQGALDRALNEAERGVAEARASQNNAVLAMTIRGRAEIRLVRGEPATARLDLSRVREIRGRIPDPVEEAEDLRVEAAVLAAEGNLEEAEAALRVAIDRAGALRRPQLLAEANRDLGLLLRRSGRAAEARAAVRAAKAIFGQLGAEGEIRRLASQEWDDEFVAELRRSLEPLHDAQQLADQGRFADLLDYLEQRPSEELAQSPMLALLFGIAHARMGRPQIGQQWTMVALSRGRILGDRTLEVRALNVCGAIALERGGISEATHFFSRAQEEAMQEDDLASVGRCANNLGIIANLQGDYGRAVGAYTRAIAAYEKASYPRGVVESQHNLGITYRELGQLDDALRAADGAVQAADRLGDKRLKAQAVAGRAEILVARGEPRMAIKEAERARSMHQTLPDDVLETEDLRILALAMKAADQPRKAEDLLREVIRRATEQERPLLVAIAQRDLAHLLAVQGDTVEATRLIHAARAAFERMGATAELTKLDAVASETFPRPA